MTFYPNANKTHLQKKGLALSLFFKVGVFVTRKGRTFYRLALFNPGHIVMCNKRCALQNQWITLTHLTDTKCVVINIKGCIFGHGPWHRVFLQFLMAQLKCKQTMFDTENLQNFLWRLTIISSNFLLSKHVKRSCHWWTNQFMNGKMIWFRFNNPFIKWIIQ